MKNFKNRSLGVLERTVLEFKEKGNSSIEEIKEYLLKKYSLTVSSNVIIKRLKSFKV
ncbi:MAG: hypothetical protein ACI9GM_000409 [Salibacteraceae bacterium]|jgi:hypothetical protein